MSAVPIEGTWHEYGFVLDCGQPTFGQARLVDVAAVLQNYNDATLPPHDPSQVVFVLGGTLQRAGIFYLGWYLDLTPKEQ